MSLDENTEIELKYDGSKLTYPAFKEGIIKFVRDNILNPTLFTETSIEKALDTFYEVNGEVLRYRRGYGDKKGELTIKNRTSKGSMLSRKEVDLKVDTHNMGPFMSALRAKELITLRKDYSLFEVETENYSLDFVRYTAYPVSPKDKACRQLPKTNRVIFIEIEVGKTSKIAVEEALELVGNLGKRMASQFRLGKPLNASLFETFDPRP